MGSWSQGARIFGDPDLSTKTLRLSCLGSLTFILSFFRSCFCYCGILSDYIVYITLLPHVVR